MQQLRSVATSSGREAVQQLSGVHTHLNIPLVISATLRTDSEPAHLSAQSRVPLSLSPICEQSEQVDLMKNSPACTRACVLSRAPSRGRPADSQL